jgi:predicted metal-dependent hydrolase
MQRPAVIGIFDIQLGIRKVTYTLKRSTTGRLVWLRINPNTGLVVTIPRHYPKQDIPSFLTSRSEWIIKHLDKLANELEERNNPHSGANRTIRYLGNSLPIIHINNSSEDRITLESNRLLIKHRSEAPIQSHAEVLIWLQQEAVGLIRHKVAFWGRLMGFRFRNVTIRDQHTRWGSCSRLKNLNFNWRIVMAPEPVLDYVIIHELCHLKEMNHSPSFWTLVARHSPDWRTHRRWLNSHGNGLRNIS